MLVLLTLCTKPNIMANKEDKPTFNYIQWKAPAEVRAVEGRRKTQGLFLETIQTDQHKKYPAVYTLCEKEQWDWRHECWLPSAKQIYILSDSEYEAAKKLVGSMEHWNRLIENDWFLEGFKEGEKDAYEWTSLKQWRQEQEQRKIALAQTVLMSQAMQGDTNAAKFLILGPKKVGRPDKITPEMHERRQREKDHAVGEDHSRLLKLVKSD